MSVTVNTVTQAVNIAAIGSQGPRGNSIKYVDTLPNPATGKAGDTVVLRSTKVIYDWIAGAWEDTGDTMPTGADLTAAVAAAEGYAEDAAESAAEAAETAALVVGELAPVTAITTSLPLDPYDGGADPTGVADCSAIIAAAIDAAAGVNGRRRIQFRKPGTYLINSTIFKTGLDEFIFEVGPDVVLKSGPIDGKYFDLRGNRLIVTGHGTFDATNQAPSGPGEANDILTMIGNDLEVTGLTFLGGAANSDSLIFLAGSRLLVEHNTLGDHPDLGIYITERLATAEQEVWALIRANKFLAGRGACSAKRGFRHFTYEDNWHDGLVYGVYTGEAENGWCEDFRVVNNDFLNMTGTSIIARGTDRAQIGINRIKNSTSSILINLQGSRNSQIFKNDLFIDPAVYVSPSTQQGIRLETRNDYGEDIHSTGNTIEGNYITNVYTAIREFDANQDYNRYINNVINGATVDYQRQGSHSTINDNSRRETRGPEVTGWAKALDTGLTRNYSTSSSGTSDPLHLGIAEGEAFSVKLDVTINNSDGTKVGGGWVEGTFKREAGQSPAIVGAVARFLERSLFSTATITLVTSAVNNTVRVRITGEPSGTVNFFLRVTTRKLATEA